MQKLGVQHVVLTSVSQAVGDEVIDFMKVNISLGNEDSMKNLVKNLKTKGILYKLIYLLKFILKTSYSNIFLGMKVMLKLVPNHSSKSNLMFGRSVLKETLYKDFYIWNSGFSNGTHHSPINNWVSHFKYFRLLLNILLIIFVNCILIFS